MISTIVIDRFTSFTENRYKTDYEKPGFDEWRNYGVSVARLVTAIQNIGFEIVLIFGKPGSGKSYGLKYLQDKSTIWFNADNKPPTWKGGRKYWGLNSNPNMPFHMVPKSEQAVLNHLKKASDKGILADRKIAFLLAHETIIDSIKGEKQLTVKLTGKMLSGGPKGVSLEGMFTEVYRSFIDEEGEHKLFVGASSDMPTRSKEDLYDTNIIDNNFALIREKLFTY